jgi:hypothetical protein
MVRLAHQSSVTDANPRGWRADEAGLGRLTPATADHAPARSTGPVITRSGGG